jgi:hypothetical protein
MYHQKIAPMQVLTTEEVCKRYAWTKSTLSRLKSAGKFPQPTGRNKQGQFWSVKVIQDYDSKKESLSIKSWTPAVAGL